jgi:hypothetical protein
MRRLSLSCAAAGIIAAATPSPLAAADIVDACRRFASERVIFIGRVTALPVRRHVPGQDQIDKMRRLWSQTESDMARRKIWPVPVDVMVTPMRVETAFRHLETADVFVLTERPDELHIGQSYLVYGHYAVNQPYPDILTITRLVAQPDPDAEEVRFLNLAGTGTVSASVYGSLMLDDDQKQVPLSGVPIRFTVADREIEAITDEVGRFVAAGMPAGVIKVEPLLPAGLSFEARPPYVIAMPDGGCSELHLTPKTDRSRRDEDISEAEN